MGKSDNRLSALAAFSLAFGCIMGWSNFIIPGTVLIPSSGVIGVLVGLFFGAFIALNICVNYIGMARFFPDSSSSYLLIKNVWP